MYSGLNSVSIRVIRAAITAWEGVCGFLGYRNRIGVCTFRTAVCSCCTYLFLSLMGSMFRSFTMLISIPSGRRVCRVGAIIY